jgi:hypothetical protein
MSEPIVRKNQRNTIYDNMEFPSVGYREFPKAIPVLNGKAQSSPYNEKGKPHPVVIVYNEFEEQELFGGNAKLVDVNADQVKDGAQRVVTEEDERAEIYVRLQQLGVQFDKRYSIQRLKKMLDEAEGAAVV